MKKFKTNIFNDSYELERMWIRAKNASRTTVNKIHTENKPTDKFKVSLLISEHSPIRLIRINWIWETIKSYCATHFARHHIGVEKFISTQRSDRTGLDRDKIPQDAPVRFEGESNAQSLINMGRVRLCGKSDPETIAQMADFKVALNEFDKSLAFVLVPNCIYRCGCPEFEQCEFFGNILKEYPNIICGNIHTRYKLYNEYFYNRRNLNEKA